MEDIPNPQAEPHALVALEHPLTVEGQLAIELMSGDEAVSLGFRLAREFRFLYLGTRARVQN